jgi:hypothetical protein
VGPKADEELVEGEARRVTVEDSWPGRAHGTAGLGFLEGTLIDRHDAPKFFQLLLGIFLRDEPADEVPKRVQNIFRVNLSIAGHLFGIGSVHCEVHEGLVEVITKGGSASASTSEGFRVGRGGLHTGDLQQGFHQRTKFLKIYCVADGIVGPKMDRNKIKKKYYLNNTTMLKR